MVAASCDQWKETVTNESAALEPVRNLTKKTSNRELTGEMKPTIEDSRSKSRAVSSFSLDGFHVAKQIGECFVCRVHCKGNGVCSLIPDKSQSFANDKRKETA